MVNLVEEHHSGLNPFLSKMFAFFSKMARQSQNKMAKQHFLNVLDVKLKWGVSIFHQNIIKT